MNVTFAPHLRLGSYELLVELAAGGMATVSVALQHGAAGFERLVVVKRVHRHLLKNVDFFNMFRDEARLASSIKHPNVVPVVDVVESAGELMLVMEYFESQPLSAMLENGLAANVRLPPPVVSRIVSDLLAGLHAAHEAVDIRQGKLGIIHRDVSPQNVIVDVDGVSRIIDFGIAKAASRLTRTKSGFVKGKVGYMSPEQIEALPIDRRTDLFAAGVVLHESLTGNRLYTGEDEFETMRRVLRGEVPDASKVATGLSRDVDLLLRKALAAKARDRFQTGLEFQAALEHVLPPAPRADVATQLMALCAPALQERRSKLQAVLGEELEKLSPRVRPLPSDTLVGTAFSEPAKTLVGMPLVEPPPASSPPVVSAHTQEEPDLVVHGLPARSSPARVAALVVVALGTAAAVVLAALHRSPEAAEPSPSAAISSPPPGASTASATSTSTSTSTPTPTPTPTPTSASASTTTTTTTPRHPPPSHHGPREPASDGLQTNPYAPSR